MNMVMDTDMDMVMKKIWTQTIIGPHNLVFRFCRKEEVSRSTCKSYGSERKFAEMFAEVSG